MDINLMESNYTLSIYTIYIESAGATAMTSSYERYNCSNMLIV